jgi:hypothetical protein
LGSCSVTLKTPTDPGTSCALRIARGWLARVALKGSVGSEDGPNGAATPVGTEGSVGPKPVAYRVRTLPGVDG